MSETKGYLSTCVRPLALQPRPDSDSSTFAAPLGGEIAVARAPIAAIAVLQVPRQDYKHNAIQSAASLGPYGIALLLLLFSLGLLECFAHGQIPPLKDMILLVFVATAKANKIVNGIRK